MKNKLKDVYVVDGLRTPFTKAMGKPNPLSAADLAVAAAGPLLARQPFKPSEINEVIAGCVAPGADEVNIARIIALRSGCGIEVPAFTVQRNCASGLQALESAALNIRSGKSELVLAGGTECMSRAPLLYPNEMAIFLAQLRSRKGLIDQLKSLLQFRPYFLKPIFSLLKGLSDPIVNLSMGQTAENLVYEFGITREAMDAFSVQSHNRASAAQKEGLFEEITPLFDWQGGMIESDNGVREGSTVEKLATLKPVFDKPFGSVTAGNSSQVTDGAAFLILASESSVKKYDLPVLGKIIDTAWAALDPAIMGLGPVYAIQKLLQEQDLSLSDIDYWEMNEAFAAQMLACLKSLGSIPPDKLNVDGGAIAIGHPVGATGARLVLHLLHVLKRNGAKRGIASLCIGGGQGGAMLVEAF
ncbi:MAG TPA: acetyl-CoA C-acetyltransferase [Gammaproteobacteria bacterium]|nr:acetyl-CoA C-acetyltransferase [Gammaproteobacteria bacterium]HRA42914.1 acetyl-CoA C-acetyltransferase [Gammaproteobacteria bacterium]